MIGQRLEQLDRITERLQDPVDPHEVRRHLDEGREPIEIAELCNRSPETIRRILRDQGLSREDYKGPGAKEKRDRDRLRVVELREAGFGVKATRNRTGFTQRYTLTLLCEAGYSGEDLIIGSRSAEEVERRQSIVDLYMDSDLSQAKVGEAFGISPSRVSQILREEGLSASVRRRWRTEEEIGMPLEDIGTLYTDERLSCAEIAERTGMSGSWVLDQLKRLGIKRRPAECQGRKKDELRERSLLILKAILVHDWSQRRTARALGRSKSVVTETYRRFRDGELDVSFEEIRRAPDLDGSA